MDEIELMNLLFNDLYKIIKYEKLMTDTFNKSLEIELPNKELFKIEIKKIDKSALSAVKYFG